MSDEDINRNTETQADTGNFMVKALMSALTEVTTETLEQYTNRDFLLSLHTDTRDDKDKTQQLLNVNGTLTSNASRATTDELISPTDRVDIEELIKNLNNIIEGKYFLGRTVTIPILQSDIVASILEDPLGVRAIRVNFYPDNFVGLLKELVPGSIVVITNPWFKVVTDGGLSLRVDDPSNFSTLKNETYQKLFPDLQWAGILSTTQMANSSGDKSSEISLNNSEEDFKKWKRAGNEKFVEKHYLEALKAYNFCLEVHPVDLDTLSNRAAVYLRLAWFSLALKDTEKVLENDPGHIKAIYRKTKSLYGLNQCKEATKFLKSQLNHIDKDAKKQIVLGELKKAEKMEKLQETREYDILTMLRNDGKRIEDCVEYTGPIKVVSAPRDGRGIITTKKMFAGEIVMVVRAFEIVFNFKSKNKASSQQNPISRYAGEEGDKVNDNNDDFESESRKELTLAIANRLKMCPSLGTEFYKLYAGPHLGVPNSDFDDTKVYQKRINAIVNFNSFRSQSCEDDVICDETFPSGKTKAIFLLPSFINHSCFDHNCVWYTIGDFIFIRTCRDILANEELTITHFKPLPEYPERKELIKEFGFNCECRLCNLESTISEEKMQLRDRIVDGFQRASHNEAATLRLTLECIEKMKQLLPETMNLDLLEMYDHLSTLYISEGRYEKSLEQLERGYRIAKANPTCCAQSIRFASSVIILLLKVAGKHELDLARLWVSRLKVDLIIAIGTFEIFKMTPNGKIIVGLLEQHGLEF